MKRLLLGIIVLAVLIRLYIYFLFNVNLLPTYSAPIIPTPTPIQLSSEKLMALVNAWRVSQGFQKYIQDERLCKISQDRVDDGSDNHKGLYDKYSNNPYVIQENSTGGISEQDALNKWLNSPPHRKTLESSYKYTCISCKDLFCVQIFSNF